jgi:3-methyladenine DNA glycosylase/8-oxoguanine DNA glycosylase
MNYAMNKPIYEDAITKKLQNFDLKKIAESGQCFRMNKIEDLDVIKYSIIAFDKYLEVVQENDNITFFCSKEEFAEVWHNYFDLDTDYNKIKALADTKDNFLMNAINFGTGIRILKQDLWETIISFIISQRNSIPRIKKCIEILCERFGEKKEIYGRSYYTFPTAKKLASLQVEELNQCSLGYRSKYILETAKAVLYKEFDLELLKQMTYENSKIELMKLYGVGMKVAECVCLFSLYHIDAFPIDTHVNQILETYYKDGFPFERYSGYAGIMQQYMFYYKLNLAKV